MTWVTPLLLQTTVGRCPLARGHRPTNIRVSDGT